MCKPKRLTSWALVLLATAVCWIPGSALAQNSKANPNSNLSANPNAQHPVKRLTNPSIQRRQNAMDALAAAVDARTQTDPQYKKFIESVKKRNNDMDAFAKKRGGK
jgi:hypothetical protein